MFSVPILIGPLIRRGRASSFSLMKIAKNQVGKKASLPHPAFTPQIGQNHGLESFAPLRSLIGPRFSKISYVLAALKATIVLPAFARSCFCRPELQNTLPSVPLQGVRGLALGIEADTGLVANARAV